MDQLAHRLVTGHKNFVVGVSFGFETDRRVSAGLTASSDGPSLSLGTSSRGEEFPDGDTDRLIS